MAEKPMLPSEQSASSSGSPQKMIDSTVPQDLKKKRKSLRKRKVPAFYEAPGWESGLRVYNDTSFERMRMPRAPHWSVAWSDLMMTMFILFAVLYLYQLDQQKEVVIGEGPGFDIGTDMGSGVMGAKGGGSIGPAGDAVSAEKQLAKIYDLSRRTLDAERLQEFASVDLTADKTVRIILTGDLLFDSGQADIKSTALSSLQKIIPLVSQTPYMINVVGHTDDMPISSSIFPSNWELSLVRASEVARFLIQETKLSPERFYITGHASFQPLRPNDSPENRAVNRRVEIILTLQKPQAVAPGKTNEKQS